ncbi:MFS transporter [Paenibacillus sp. Aloe-11]|uniref:MFS transporter n=1 Tax=Paenibacillus sp. Aloe-11 TaxID=1050222 RepID=UPI00024EF6E7|nr:MFS transporter [Paenibacillus sp. Aloe-11]EHS59134.1 Permease of the major facilitator superfamily [Paenibacillus sp. Aloe-11]
MRPSQKSNHLYPWFVLSVTSLGVLLVLLNVGTLNVALPVVSQHFNVGANFADWIVLSYLLVNTILILVFGQLSDIYGRKKLYLIGMATFTIASLIIGFSPNVWVLIIFRCIQAAGGALVITNTTALITDSFPEHSLGKGLGINVLVAAVAQLFGPVLGGLMASTLGWRWVFWFNVPFGIIGLIWGIFTLRSTKGRNSNGKPDVLGGAIVFLSLGGLIIALSEGSTLGWGNWLVLLGFLLFIVLTPIFVIIEKHVSSPLIDLTLFRNRQYTLANAATLINFFSITALTLLIALYYQATFQETATQAGLKVLPVTIGMLIISPIAGAMIRRIEARLLATAGLITSAIGLLVLTIAISPDVPYSVLGIGMFLAGLGCGLFMTPNTASIMASVPENRRGIANGLRSMLNSMGQVLSTAVGLMIVKVSLPDRLKDVIYVGSSTGLSTQDLSQIANSYRIAFMVLFAVNVLGIVLSVLRGKK